MHPLDGQLELKFLVVENRMPGPREFVPVLHDWIQTRRLPDELLIDVADYSHVHHGPGVVLVGHEAIYAIDQAEGRPGLVCRLRRPASSDGSSKLHDLFRRALRARDLLQEEPTVGGGFRFRNDEMRFRIHDRRVAPNRESTFAAVEPELSSFLAELYRASVRLEPLAHSEEPFAVRIEIDAASDPKRLLERLQASRCGGGEGH